MKKEDLYVGQKVMINYGNCKGEVGKIEKIEKHKVYLGDELGYWFIDSIDPVDELECLEEGQILCNKNENYNYIKVLFKIGGSGELTTYQMSRFGNEAGSKSLKYANRAMTVFELKELGCKPYHPEAEETVEVTMEQVCEKFGKNVKIKKD